jgi:cytochrome c biogenesis protein CcdA
MDLLLGTTLFASFLGGFVALLAPCCVSVMLPAYFASTFARRTQIVGMTLIFAAGVGTIILPIALGASALSALVSGHHTLVFSIGGVAMVAGGIAMLAGRKLMLPMPSSRGGTGHGLGAVYGLGAFSGAASACCAPVLAGVAAVSGAAASFPAALAVGVAYVFGMVAPLAAIALVWDRHDWGSTRLLTGRTVTWRLGRHQHRIPLFSALSGGLMLAMGVLTVALAFRGQSMATDGWQVQMSAWLTHTASGVRASLDWVPGPILSALVAAALVGLIVTAIRASRPPRHPPRTTMPPPEATTLADQAGTSCGAHDMRPASTNQSPVRVPVPARLDDRHRPEPSTDSQPATTTPAKEQH